MPTPPEGVGSAPLYGGLSGYRRPAPGKPTSIPGSLPAFRGAKGQPGDRVKAPAIASSKNRNDRGTNVTIPYSRICPISGLSNVGRVSPGDVVFTSTKRVSMHQVPTMREQRIVGTDFLNKALGNDSSGQPDGLSINQAWVVGQTVVIGGPTWLPIKKGDVPVTFDPVGSNVADNWRHATFLREWVCDGVVLSNDEPAAMSSSGQRDAQLFNICVQGRCAVNNGYVDWQKKGVESEHRSYGAGVGYSDSGEVGRPHDFGTVMGGPFYNSYPMQMFDRKIKPLSDVFVGLVATKRVMTERMKEALLLNSPYASAEDRAKLATDSEYNHFYTFKFCYFSSRSMWQQTHPDARRGAAEPPGKKQRNVHYDDRAGDGREFYDPFEPMSQADYRGLVGAWRIGKCLDTSAARRDQYMGGPVDTTFQITLNVNLEWVDWRVLRRLSDRIDVGMYVSGAPAWMKLSDPGGNILPWSEDDGRTLLWPTKYEDVKSSDSPAETIAKQTLNMPLDMQEIDTYQQAVALAAKNGVAAPAPDYKHDGLYREPSTVNLHSLQTPIADQKVTYDGVMEAGYEYNNNTPKGVKAKIQIWRASLGDPATDTEVNALWTAFNTSRGGSHKRSTLDRFKTWIRTWQQANRTAAFQALANTLLRLDARSIGRADQIPPDLISDNSLAALFIQIAYMIPSGTGFNLKQITKAQLKMFLQPPAPETVEKLTPVELESIGSAMDWQMENADGSFFCMPRDVSKADYDALMRDAGNDDEDVDMAPESSGLSFGLSPASGTVAAVVTAPAATSKPVAPAPKASGKAPASKPKAAAPPPPAAAAADPPAAAPTTSAAAAAAAAPPAATGTAPRVGRPGANRGRAANEGTDEIFASIFGGSGGGSGTGAAPTGTEAAASASEAVDAGAESDASSAPSPTAASGAGRAAGRGVRRARDGR